LSSSADSVDSAARPAPPGDAPGPLSGLEARLGHAFGHRGHLSRALTHKSRGADNNERLEHLGDSVIGFVVTDALFARFPSASEGDLTRMRARLVGREELAARARELNLQSKLRLGHSVAGNVARNEGGDAGDALLADAFEAVVGAVYLDAGLEVARRVVIERLADSLARVSPGEPKDAKTQLQEYLQKRGRPLPAYQVIERAGKPHAPVFTVECSARGLVSPVTALGDTRRIAEQRAAAAALAQLQGDA